MKSSIHLFYGIIIGVLICACTGSIKSDKAEFEVEEIKGLGVKGFASYNNINKNIAKIRKEGWTIIDIEVRDKGFTAHVGK